MHKLVAVITMALLFAWSMGAAADRPRGAVECADLQWSEQVLNANPDIAHACRGVFEKDGVLYAKATIEVTRVQGNTLRFRTLRTDGKLGKPRSVTLNKQWRVNIDGREYRLSDLNKGQRMNIYLPQDRFALTVMDSRGAQASPIEEVIDE